jgi:PleD family two-component response regulator
MDPDYDPLAAPGRVLVICEGQSGVVTTLGSSRFEAVSVVPLAARHSVLTFAPDLVVFEFDGAGGRAESEGLALARTLRSDNDTAHVPLVFVFREQQERLYRAALALAVDDYLPSTIATGELMARLDLLLWRTRVRRQANGTPGPQAHINEFLTLVDGIREDIGNSWCGSVALVSAASRAEATLPANRLLHEVHGFLRLNLRRVDGLAFYGPALLLVYLPRTDSYGARVTLFRLRWEFISQVADSAISIGIASYPVDGNSLEELLEKAEAALQRTKAGAVQSVLVPAAVEVQSLEGRGVAVVAPEPTPAMTPPVAPEVTRQTVARSGLTLSAQSHVTDAYRKLGAEAAAAEQRLRQTGVTMPKRLLLAVAEPTRRAQLNSLLRSAGYESRSTFDGRQTLELLNIERPDLALIDYDLQDINGIELLRRMKSEAGLSTVPAVVLLLPHGLAELRNEAIELGARCVAGPPYDPVDLLSSIRLAGKT